MKPFLCTFVLLIIFLVAGVGSPRKLPEDYWKTIMNGEVMPEAIKNLLHQNTESRASQDFIKDFDAKSNVIIYHSHVDSHEKILGADQSRQKFAKDFDVKPNVIIYHSYVDAQEKISGASSAESQSRQKFVKDFDGKPNVIISHSHVDPHGEVDEVAARRSMDTVN